MKKFTATKKNELEKYLKLLILTNPTSDAVKQVHLKSNVSTYNELSTDEQR